ncbi:tetratricopeptide repeat protein [Microbacterium sp. KUDC0406]|uniref:tetratricopeptide repeat protein n=1 Tax=Microbacterium sp. KUDC0406 TaxID=2909588 RepID=UPI001F25E792|nr:tetratricopeptide repeat protein [Microbacterium sp. KUDC0406]UJP11002.1 tetratricopeptide repeat protein [Microbacterium sp. KUDC0406]
MSLDVELDRIVAARNRDDMQPTIDALLPYLETHPGAARVLYEVGGAYDTAGEEEIARGFYERALDAGLQGDVLRRCYLQYGSTLRNLGELERSLEVFDQGLRAFPGSPSLAVFRTLTLHAAGRADAAIAGLLEVIAEEASAPDLDRYRLAIRRQRGVYRLARRQRRLTAHGAGLDPAEEDRDGERSSREERVRRQMRSDPRWHDPGCGASRGARWEQRAFGVRRT